MRNKNVQEKHASDEPSQMPRGGLQHPRAGKGCEGAGLSFCYQLALLLRVEMVELNECILFDAQSREIAEILTRL
ncbi:hypothetical protein [Bartonella tribocorum]|uniref:Uncharacterized protein n=1 Tax=Bartonella tribocorum TaxID=85701 RepID=A0A2M6USW7_9HYPH|nr:hypothetical protein [Bartonella tribocorum]PIT69273.1 hypothetical protein CEV08_06460 [Bartonella tribocorum]